MSENAWIDDTSTEGVVWGPWVNRENSDEIPDLFSADFVEIETRDGESMDGTVDNFDWGDVGGGTIVEYRIRHVGPWKKVTEKDRPYDIDSGSYVEVENAMTDVRTVTPAHDVLWHNVSRYRHISLDHAKGNVYVTGL